MGVKRNSRLRAGQSFVTFIADKRRLTSEDILEMESATNWSAQHPRRRHVFIRRAFDKWGEDAVFAGLDQTERHAGSMSETCRGALTFHLTEVTG